MADMNISALNVTEEYPLPGFVYTVLGILLMFTFTFGTITNACALMCFLRFSNLRSNTNMFIASLNLADFGMSFIATPWSMTSNLSRRWLWGDTGCVIEGFLVYFFGLTSMYNLAAISIDRYFVIARPLQASKITTKVAFLAISSCWLGGAILTCMPLLGWNRYERDVHGTSCTIAIVDESDPGVRSFNMCIFFTNLVIPVTAMAYSYYGVLMTLRSVTRSGVWDMNSSIARRNLKIEKKMTKTIVTMIGVFLGSWSPYAIVFFWGFFGDIKTIPLVAVGVAAIIAKSASTWNPLIYFATNKIFRISAIKLLPCGDLRDQLLAKEEGGDDSDDEGDPEPKTKSTAVAPAPQASQG